MAKIGKLEIKTPRPDSRIRVVKLPGHRLSIEHFFPSNWEHVKAIGRSDFVRSKIGRKPTFVRKNLSRKNATKLTLTSEARLAAHIKQLEIPRLSVEAPLALLLHPSGQNSAIYRELKGEPYHSLEHLRMFDECGYIRRELQKHGIEPGDIQWFSDKGKITLIDIEHFTVSDELKKKLGLRYIGPVYD